MEEASLGLEFKDNQMIIETLSGKEYYNKVAGTGLQTSSAERKNSYVLDQGDDANTPEAEILYADEIGDTDYGDTLGIDGYVDVEE